LFNNISEKIGKNITFYRKEKGLSQTDLAKKLGLSLRSIQNYEYGITSLNIEKLVNIASIIEVKLSDLLEINVESEEIQCTEQYIIQDSNGEYIKIVEYGDEVWFYRVKDISFATAFKTKKECKKAINCDLVPHVNKFVPYGLKELKIKKFNTTYHLIEEFVK
jgi:transcriptional regulator with XRE-family HTH domain